MAFSLGAANVEVGADTKGLKGGIGKAKGMLGSLGVKGAAAFAGIAAAALGAVAAVVSVGIAVKGVTQAFTDLDKISKQASRLGITAESLQKVSFAAEQSGANADEAADFMKELQKRTAEAARTGGGPAAEAFKAMGIEASEIANLGIEDQIKLLAGEFEKLSSSEKLDLADKLGGEAAIKMIPLLNEGAEGIDKLFKQKEGLGIISQAELDKIAEANDAFNRLGHRIKFIFSKIAVIIAPALEFMTDKINASVGWGIKKFQEWLPLLQSWGASFMAFIGPPFEWIKTKLTEWISFGIKTFQEWTPVFVQFFNTVSAYFGMVLDVTKSIWDAIMNNVLIPVANFVSGTFTKVFGDFAGMFVGIKDKIIVALALMEFAYKNWRTVLDIAINQVVLSFEIFKNDIINIFTNVLPTVFTSFLTFTGTFFANLSSNITNAITEIWDFITSWGADDMDFVWKPLSEGAMQAFEDIKNAARRELTDVEKIMQDSLQKKKDKFAKDAIAFTAARLEPKPKPEPEPDKKLKEVKAIEKKLGKARKIKVEIDKASFGSLTKPWEDAMKKSIDKDNVPKAQLDVAKKGNEIAIKQLDETKKLNKNQGLAK